TTAEIEDTYREREDARLRWCPPQIPVALQADTGGQVALLDEPRVAATLRVEVETVGHAHDAVGNGPVDDSQIAAASERTQPHGDEEGEQQEHFPRNRAHRLHYACAVTH